MGTVTPETVSPEVGAGIGRNWGLVKELLRRNAKFLPDGWQPHPMQAFFLALSLSEREVLYGGAAGGGKSEAMLGAAAMYLHEPTYSAGLFRWTYQDLALPGALMDRAQTWWSGKAHWNGSEKTFTFPSKATVTFGYLRNPTDHLRYQGAEFQFTGFDELTQLQEHQYRYVGRSRVRRVGTVMHIPLRTVSGSNPGGPGHVWVKKRFVTGPLPFVPAKISDNPTLDAESYIAGLEGLDSTTKAQLLAGDWDARSRGDYFRREWFGPLLEAGPDPQRSFRIRWWDLAATERPDDEKGQRPRTAGVEVAKDWEGVYTVEHAIAFSKTPGARDQQILQVAQADGFGCVVGIEEEPGSGGVAQCETLKKLLRSHGFRVVVEKATASKEERADPVASELERGWACGWIDDTGEAPRPRGVRLVAGPWTEDYLDEVEGFPDVDRKDLADATASAFNWLKVRFYGGTAPDSIGAKPDAQTIGAPIPPPGIYAEDLTDDDDRAEKSKLAGLVAQARYHRSVRDRIAEGARRRRW